MQLTTAKSIVLRSFSFDSLLILSSLALIARLLIKGYLEELGRELGDSLILTTVAK